MNLSELTTLRVGGPATRLIEPTGTGTQCSISVLANDGHSFAYTIAPGLPEALRSVLEKACVDIRNGSRAAAVYLGRQALVADTLDRFNIVGKKDLYPSQLSGGQQQLVGIARAVVHAPALLLADEPTGNLHSTQAREIMELFRELNRAGTTIVQVTHSDENSRYGSRILELHDGWLTRDEAVAAPIEEVKAQ